MNYEKEIEQIEAYLQLEHMYNKEAEPIRNLLTLTKQMHEHIKDLRMLLTIANVNQAEEWIPCSERLPNKIGRYLATIQFPTDFEKKYRSIDKVVFEIYPETTRWNCEGEVIAWMPLPEPFTGDL